ncbi:MAG: FecR family protein [Gemmatimonadaceae bacterium]
MKDDRDEPLNRFPAFRGMELSALRRYLVGESSAAEQRRVEVWAEQSAERRRYLDSLRRLYHRAPLRQAAEAVAAWQRILRQLEPPSDEVSPRFRAPWDEQAVRVHVRSPRRARVLLGAFHRERSPWTVLVAGAATTLLLAVGVHLSGVRVTQATAAAMTSPMRTVTTTRGQRAEIRLDDGTRVVLGVDSRIVLASDFGLNSRNVYLDGTAYFEVVHDRLRPFVVHTVNAVARDVGTKFVVRAYPGDRSTQVVVTQGSVALGAPGAAPAREAVLMRDQLGLLAAGQSRPAVRAVDPSRYTAWMHGDLVFRDTPLAVVARELQRWYNIDVRIGDASLARVPFSASFDAESFREALSTITTVLPLRAVRKGSVVTLYRR